MVLSVMAVKFLMQCGIFIHISVPEREERERKGDLDQYERLDGDRNQTNKYLAVKKVPFCVIYNLSAL